jgi:serine phosphatase RsbU (regulator of sigma subunit)
MDMALVIIDRSSQELQYAGAYNPLYLIRKKYNLQEAYMDAYRLTENEQYKLYEIKADKQPIGVHWEESAFTDHTLKLQDSDSIYLFSDGFLDQFGGEKRKKFKVVKFKKMLLSLQDMSMKEQHRNVEETFDKWSADCDQIDDVCVIGIKI